MEIIIARHLINFSGKLSINNNLHNPPLSHPPKPILPHFLTPKITTMLALTLLIILISFLFFFVKPIITIFFLTPKNSPKLPKFYPFYGNFLSLIANGETPVQWLTDMIKLSPSYSFKLVRPFATPEILTANPANIQHILKTRFDIYEKGNYFRETLQDLLGDGIFNVDGKTWKFQRQVASHEFNTKSLRKFVEQVVDTELSDRLIPIISTAAKNSTVLDFQDVLKRFTFDNICKIAFGYDPEYLLPTLPQAEFAVAFEQAVKISNERLVFSLHPMIWKTMKYFNIGSEKTLRVTVQEIRDFARKIIREKKRELEEKSTLESVDLLSRFLSSGIDDENFVMDIAISFLLAGRDTTSAGLTWFFWLLSKNPEVEKEILKEIEDKSDANLALYDEVKDMVYTHAAISESMRLYPPVPIDPKEAQEDDVLPDGNIIKKGMRVTYHVYAMGRLPEIWGRDWAEFRPERWLKEEGGTGKRRFVPKDSYAYPVFQAGPRVCLGKEMAYLQMKRVIASILRRFRVVPVGAKDGSDPIFTSYLTGYMVGGFPVRFEERTKRV